MKCTIPEIAWHNRDPVLSVDFQPTQNQNFFRLATGGCDSHVVIWYVKTDESGTANIEVAADLFHHQKAVNVVRWSPNGEFLASGDDESAIIIWKQKTDLEPPPLFEQNSDQDRETWTVYKILRGHVEDVYDLSWCPMSKFLISGSVDNTAVLWDIHKGKSMGILNHKGFVQGVIWDPKNQYLATMSSDRVFRVFDVNTKKAVARSCKGILPVPVLHPLKGQVVRFFHDDTLQSFFRRLHVSPDGELIAVPAGFSEGDPARGIKNTNTAYIYSRYSLNVPICVLPCGDSPALAVRWCPIKFKPRLDGPQPLVNLPNGSRMILAVGTNDSITLYDTQQSTPLAVVINPQYARLTDMTWSCDGNVLIVSSSDGYCAIITFLQNELGEILCDVASEATNTKTQTAEPMDVDTPNKEVKSNTVEVVKETKNDNSAKKGDIKKSTIFEIKNEVIKTKSPKAKSLFGVKQKSEQLKSSTVIMDEAAMEPWSQDGFAKKLKSSSPPKDESDKIIIDDPTQDIKLVYDETDDNSDKNSKKPDGKEMTKSILVSSKTETPPLPSPQEAKPVKESNSQQTAPVKTPRRVSFITLSSPKNKKRPV